MAQILPLPLVLELHKRIQEHLHNQISQDELVQFVEEMKKREEAKGSESTFTEILDLFYVYVDAPPEKTVRDKRRISAAIKLYKEYKGEYIRQIDLLNVIYQMLKNGITQPEINGLILEQGLTPAEVLLRKPMVEPKDSPFTILLIDYDDRFRMYYHNYFVDNSYYIESYSNFENALEAAKKQKFGVTLLDVSPKDLSFGDYIRTFKHENPSGKILMLTSPGIVDSQIKDAFEAGADDYFMRTGATFDSLVSKMKELLGK